MDKWSKLRLYSVQSNLCDHIGVVRENLLRYGYLIKANLPREYRDNVLEVDYSLRKMTEPCTILYIDKTSTDNIKPSNDYVKLVEELVGSYKVSVYEDSETMLVLDIIV